MVGPAEVGEENEKREDLLSWSSRADGMRKDISRYESIHDCFRVESSVYIHTFRGSVLSKRELASIA